jgi:hypothetical protein
MKIRRYSGDGGKKQVAYDLMKIGAFAALGYGVNDWRNRGKELKLTKSQLERCVESRLNQRLSRTWNPDGSKFVKHELGPERVTEQRPDNWFNNFGKRRRSRKRRSTRRKSRKGSKRRKSTRRRKSRKSHKKRSFGRKRRTTKRRRSHKRRTTKRRRTRRRRGSKKSKKSSRKH